MPSKETKTSKVKKAKKRKLTLKEEGFIRDVVKTKNLTQSALNNYNVKSKEVASQIGSQNFRKLHIRTEIVEAFNRQGLDTTKVFETHKRNLLQDKHLGVSQSAIVDYYELTGIKKKEDNTNTNNIAFIINA